MPLTSIDRVSSWAKKDIDAARQAEVTRCIVAASSIIAKISGRQLERVTRSISLDGCDATGRDGMILRLPPGDRPVLHTGSDLVTVSESGRSLTVATGYSTSAGVIVKGANRDERCSLIRNGAGWYWDSGYQDILVGYKCGWTLDVANDTQPVPDHVIQLANALAWMIYLEPAWIGKLNESAQGAAVTLSNELPAYESEVLRSLMGL